MIFSILLFFLIVTAIAPIFGKYIAIVFADGRSKNWLKLRGFSFPRQNCKDYFFSLLTFNLVCIVCTFLILFFQKYLPTGRNLPQELDFAASFNAAISFVTGTFWQSHNPEKQLSIFSQIFALTTQNFLSGATGVAVFVSFVRGITNNNDPHIGNFYEDFLRSLFWIFLPTALIIALILGASGVPHNFTGWINYLNLEEVADQLYTGPAAGQMAIKHIAANGGSIFEASGAHPFESPSRIAIMLQLFLITIMPVSLIFTYGFLVKAIKFSCSLYAVVIFVMVSSFYVLYLGETEYSIPLILNEKTVIDNFNYIGKELIYDKFPSLMWVLAITMSTDGTTNACLENYSPLSTLVLFSNLVMSKFIMEGVGSGFFAMLAYLIISVFLRGLITGNNANFFGKKISINEINYVIIVFLILPIGVLLFTGITFLLPQTRSLISYHGSQAVTDIAFNFASNFAGNGSSFSGLDSSNDYFNYLTALAMFIGRYTIIYYSLAISGSFACKKKIHEIADNQTQSGIELSIFLLITVLVVGAIMFTPLMILGPLLEFMSMFN